MKEVLFFATLITMMSCTYVEPEMETVDNDVKDNQLDFYLDEFEYQAALRGFSIDLDQLDLEIKTRQAIAQNTILRILGQEEKSVQNTRKVDRGKASGTNQLGQPN